MTSEVMQTEFDVAEAVRDGREKSGVKFHNVYLFAIRITGTGASYRLGEDEYVWRDPALYLNEGFLKRCNGLAVILEHPKKGVLDSEEYADRNVGSVFLPYLKMDEGEVWGICRIYDEDTALFLRENQLSTSPSVVFAAGKEGITHSLDDGSKLLVEAEGVLLDHVAICEQGVWDKGNSPSGVDNGSGERAVAKEDDAGNPKDEPKEAKPDTVKKPDAAEPEASGDIHSKLDAIMDCVGATVKRMDAMQSRMDAFEKPKPDAAEEPKKEEPKADAAEDKAKADAAEAMAKRLDAMEEAMKPKPDSEEDEKAETQAKCDAVYSAHGERAKPPMVGEKARAYQLRLLKPIQRHSAAWKDIDLSTLPPQALAIADSNIRADAMRAAEHPSAIPEGKLLEIRQKVNGVDVVTFKGDWNTAFAPFRIKPRKYAGRVQPGVA